MPDWDTTERHMGPADADPPAPVDAPAKESAADEFDPRYCVRCRRRLSRAVSDSQGACDDCLNALQELARAPVGSPLAACGIGPNGSPNPVCPGCGSESVTREWVTDWAAKAVDIVSDAAAFAIGALASGPRYGIGHVDRNTEIGTTRIMRHKCLDCGRQWRA